MAKRSLTKYFYETWKELLADKPFWPYGMGLFLVLLFIDQYTKRAIVGFLPLGHSIEVMPWLWFTHTTNTGTIWGLLADSNAIFVFISVMIFFVLVYFHDQFQTLGEKLSYTLILAGLWGNLLDRLTFSFVIDFINLGWWPVFNIADSAIVVGVTVYLLEQIRIARATSS